MSDIKLTIAIPVYNGERFITKTLNSIAEEVSSLPSETCSDLEILVSDNCSIDNTKHEVDKFKSCSNLIINYNFNSENLGYDKNLDVIFDRAKGIFVWLLGCGETIKKGAIKKLVDKLGDHDVSVFFLGFDSFEERTGEIKTEICIDDDLFVRDKTEFMKFPGIQALAVSQCVFSKADWLRTKRDLFEDGWCHVERLLSIVLDDDFKGLIYLDGVYFTLLREQDGWWATELWLINNLSFYFLKMRFLTLFCPEIGLSEARDIVVESILSRRYSARTIFSAIILAKRRGFCFDDTTKKRIKTIYGNCWYYIFLKIMYNF
nr:glycosyltransferase family 2 protein [uncultured Dethiosulfovibrio sp.]